MEDMVVAVFLLADDRHSLFPRAQARVSTCRWAWATKTNRNQRAWRWMQWSVLRLPPTFTQTYSSQKSHASHAHRAAASFCAPYTEYKSCIALSVLHQGCRSYAAAVSRDVKTLESELASVTRVDLRGMNINRSHVVDYEYIHSGARVQ
jgi:hypothetical protein